MATQTHLPINVPVAVLEAFVLAHKDRVLQLLGVDDQSLATSPISPAYTQLEGRDSKPETDQESLDTRDQPWKTAGAFDEIHSRDRIMSRNESLSEENINDGSSKELSYRLSQDHLPFGGDYKSDGKPCLSGDRSVLPLSCRSPSFDAHKTDFLRTDSGDEHRRRFNLRRTSCRSESSLSPSSSISSLAASSSRGRSSPVVSGHCGGRSEEDRTHFPNALLVQQDVQTEADVITFANRDDRQDRLNVVHNTEIVTENDALLNSIASNNPRIVSRTRSGVLPGTYQLTNLQDWGPNQCSGPRHSISNSISMGSLKDFIHRCGPFISNVKIPRPTSDLGSKALKKPELGSKTIKRPDYIPLEGKEIATRDDCHTSISMPRSTSMPTSGVAYNSLSSSPPPHISNSQST